MSTDTPQPTDSTEPRIYAVDAVPNDYQINGRFELHPNDITTTPPCTISLYMSPQFTNDGGADVDEGKTRHYVIELAYPEGVDDTIVQMDDGSCAHGNRIFERFVRDLADEKGYRMERKSIVEMLEAEQADD